MARSPLRRAIDAYAAALPEREAATDAYVGLVTSIIDEAGINYLTVTGRAKSVASFGAKARRLSRRDASADPLVAITDQVGVRVITYVKRDVQAVVELLAQQFTVLDDRDLGQETAQEGRFGYASRHLLVSLDSGPDAAYDPMRCASIQLRTVLQHAWAEFEHDIRYKGTVPSEQAPDLDRRFTLAAGLLELADREFGEIRDRIQAGLTDQAPSEGMTPVASETAGSADAGDAADTGDGHEPHIDEQELATFLAGRYASAGWSRTDHYEWMAGLLAELEIMTVDELSAALRDVDSQAITAAMAYKYPPGAVRRLDDDLLARYRDDYLELAGNAHRREALRARLDKVVSA